MAGERESANLLKEGATSDNASNSCCPSFNCCRKSTKDTSIPMNKLGVNDKLLKACKDGNSHEVDELLHNEGVNINATDDDGCTPLHYACKVSNEGIVKRLIEKGADWSKISNDGCTPLHYACKAGNEEIFKHLIEKGADCSIISDDGRTLLHYACEGGNEEIFNHLIEKGADCFKTSKDNRTPLHYACEGGNERIVGCLIGKGVDCCEINDEKHACTPLHYACKQGHTEIVKLLLKHGADITNCNNDGLNPLEVAVEERHEDAAIAIVNSKHWKEALRNCTTKTIKTRCQCIKKGETITPMRRIIKKMPEVAKVVFDRCYETKGSPDDKDYEITYNYEFIEDLDLGSPVKCFNKSIEVNCLLKSRYYNQNHCLNILAETSSAKLLSHPLALTLLDHKWNTYGQFFYYANVIFYFLFVIFQTSFALSVHSPSSGKCIQVFGNTNDTFINCFPEESFVPQKFISYASPILITCSIIMLMIREFFQLVWLRLQYFKDLINYVEILLFVFTIIIASVRSSECYCTRPWQWQIGVMAVFLSWIALILSIRKLPIVGIYVVMFVRICYNFMKIALLALLLILAFAFPCYMTFYDAQDRSQRIRTPFITPWRSVFKTIMMTMGEYSMDSVLQQNNERNSADAQYPVFAFSLLIMFMILMPILFLNLLIGLAVGDTEEIRKSADTHRQILKVEFILPIEGFLRSVPQMRTILNNRLTKKASVKPNDSQSCRKEVIDYLTWFDKHYQTEPPATVADVKNQNRPLAEEVKDLRSSVTSVSQEVKDLRSSMDQLLAIVKSMDERQGRGGGEGGTRGGGGLGAGRLEEVV